VVFDYRCSIPCDLSSILFTTSLHQSRGRSLCFVPEICMSLLPGRLFWRDPIWGYDRLVSSAKVIENQYTSSFICTDSSDSDTPDTSPSQDPYENVNGQNVARAYTVGNNVERKAYVGTLHYYNKCSMHHEGPCMVKCGNWKRVGHMTRDCKVTVVATALRSPIGNLMGVTCYECGRQGHYRTEYPKLKKQNRGNKKGNNEAKARSYAIGGGGGSSPDSNVVTGTFLLNNRYASMLFDSGIDKSFVLTRICFLAQLMYKKQCKQFLHYMGLFPLTGCARLSILMYSVTEAVVL
nr:hypothetical protein [Tanacetum cinerariifolium]